MSISVQSKRTSWVSAIVSLAVLPCLAFADVTSDMGSGFAIPDNGYNGMDSGYASGTINVTGHNSDPTLVITDVMVTVNANHTWVGDLSMFIESPDGTRVGLLSRPGLVETGNPGQCCGFGDDWLGSPEVWMQGANTNTETSFTAGNLGIGTIWGGTIGTGTSPVLLGNADLAAFDGLVANGIWTLRVADGAGLDVGMVNSWQLDIVTEGKGGGECTNPLGDVNLDGLVNLLDINPFVALLSDGGFQCEADVNEDGIVNLLDINPFVNILSGG